MCGKCLIAIDKKSYLSGFFRIDCHRGYWSCLKACNGNTIWWWLWRQNIFEWLKSQKAEDPQKIETSKTCKNSTNRMKWSPKTKLHFLTWKSRLNWWTNLRYSSLATFFKMEKNCKSYKNLNNDLKSVPSVCYTQAQTLKTASTHPVRWWNCIDYKKFVCAERGMMVN